MATAAAARYERRRQARVPLLRLQLGLPVRRGPGRLVGAGRTAVARQSLECPRLQHLLDCRSRGLRRPRSRSSSSSSTRHGPRSFSSAKVVDLLEASPQPTHTSTLEVLVVLVFVEVQVALAKGRRPLATLATAPRPAGSRLRAETTYLGGGLLDLVRNTRMSRGRRIYLRPESPLGRKSRHPRSPLHRTAAGRASTLRISLRVLRLITQDPAPQFACLASRHPGPWTRAATTMHGRGTLAVWAVCETGSWAGGVC
mmetsp:Transcript_22798/g.71441  ORF Transcript_22798/g.71441 Transcript_22798/m.71441 type:complete len:256 (-) Transcript_22798:928-1695(-)